MPVIDPAKVPVKTGSIYPEPYAGMMKGRSSLRHWHLNEDEFVMVTEGECTLVQDAGETVMRPGDCAAFPAGSTDGHHFINRSDRVARFLVVGTKAPREVATYSDVDLRVEIEGGKARFTYRDGQDWTGPR
ncbi:cupin domain-containing protein [Rhodobacter calidifons]|uniref:Cupin domain-containing protein n=1 Tax=Rhodobacter calidifons TaxID=2715277 RepID=A0ABX0G5C6_9RHOB|nr:cupin domain-containing protein [Rhodobacter calidifons]NHB76296.1 cupin domain-containing protein [Rhodobacter calidifons]